MSIQILPLGQEQTRPYVIAVNDSFSSTTNNPHEAADISVVIGRYRDDLEL